MISCEVIQDSEFDSLIDRFDAQIDYLRKQFNIELKSYGNFLRLVLNTIQGETFDDLLERLENNRELEKALDNVGGYDLAFLGDSNPKCVLEEIIRYSKEKALKSNQLTRYLLETRSMKCVVADIKDIDFLKSITNKQNVRITSYREIKRNEFKNEILVFYSFNGSKDFGYLYNLSLNITLILFNQEYLLFQKQLLKRQELIEEELTSISRSKLCGIKYDPILTEPIHISETIEGIVERIDDLGTRAYNGYREESDSLLDELEDIEYVISFSNSEPCILKGSDTVFDEKGNLVRVSKIGTGSLIRIYPLEQFADKLYQVAVETEPDIFGKVEDHSKLWITAKRELNKKYTVESLYIKLKDLGLRVLPTTVESYNKGLRKFPMFNSDLRAIMTLFYTEMNKADLDELVRLISKSKSTYNSTMIALGRGIKQELKLFLQDNIIGEILQKKDFTSSTLHTFVNKSMPLLTVVNKNIYENKTGQLHLTLFNELEYEPFRKPR